MNVGIDCRLYSCYTLTTCNRCLRATQMRIKPKKDGNGAIANIITKQHLDAGAHRMLIYAQPKALDHKDNEREREVSTKKKSSVK